MTRFAWLTVLAITTAGVAPAQDAGKPVTKIAFGSCADQTKPCPIWAKVADEKPDVLVLLGDNIYADLEDGKLVAANPAKIKACYDELAKVADFKRLRDGCRVVATWDDHDYGHNDAGYEYEHKDASQKLFLDFFGVPAGDPRRSRKGVYHAETFGPAGQRVQVIALDGRYHRSPLDKGPRAQFPGYTGLIAPYLPNTKAGATMLGDEQWTWLEEQLRQPADLRLIGSGIQVVSDDHPFEKWANIPAERDRLYKLIRDTKANGVVFLSGDRHLGELSLDPDAVGYPLYDVTSSGLNQGSKNWRPVEKNRRRVAAVPYGDNYGLVTVNWAGSNTTVSLQLRDEAGEIVVRHTVKLSVLRDEKPAEAKLPPGVLTPQEALRKVGEEVTVQMTVQSGRGFKERILLNSEKDFRGEKNLTVVVNAKALTGPWKQATFDTFKDKTVRVKGTVTKYAPKAGGEQIEIMVNDEKQIEIVTK
jgi:alkaline phosphatase D